MTIKFIFCYFSFCFCLFSQDIVIIDSETKKSISNAKAVVTNKTFYSDINGTIKFTNLELNDTIYFSHINYEILALCYKEIDTSKFIYLKPKLIEEKEVLIKENIIKKDITEIGKVFILNNDKKNRFSDFSDFIKKNTNIFIKDYGGDNGLKVFSQRGLSSENTAVLFNEFKVNEVSSGQYDLSNINLGSVDKINYSKNYDYMSGIVSGGGILNIISDVYEEKPSLYLKTKYSSDYLKSINANFSSGLNYLSYKLNFEYSQSPNMFPFIFENEKYYRINSDFEKYYTNLSIKYISFWVYDFYFNYKYFKSGIPGFVVNNNLNSSSARSETNNLFSAIKISKDISSNVNINTAFNFTIQGYKMNDPYKELLITDENQETKILSSTYYLRGKYRINNFESQLGYDFNYSELKEKFMEKRLFKRIQNDLFITTNLKLFKNSLLLEELTLSSIVKQKILSTEKKVFWDYGIGVMLKPNYLKNIELRLNYSYSNRITTFNEIFYSNLVQKNELKPEKYYSFDINLNYENQLLEDLSLNLSYFYIKGEDKIIWLPTRLAYQTPVNISKVISKGLEISLSQRLFNEVIDYQINYSFTDVKNMSALSSNDRSYNKYLVYSPLHKINSQINLNLENITLGLYGAYYSEVFYTDDNDPLNKLKGYFILDLALKYKLEILKYKQSLILSIMNLLNQEYFVIQSYPMPLRSFILSYEIELF